MKIGVTRPSAMMPGRRAAERGSVLIVSLVMLIVMTLIGITSVSTSSLQERMAGNTRDMALAFQAAEAALRSAETWFEETPGAGKAFGSQPGMYTFGTHPRIHAAETWASARPYPGHIDGVAEQPRFILEELGTIGDNANSLTDMNITNYGDDTGGEQLTAARITARGVGGTPGTVVYLQSTFAKLD